MARASRPWFWKARRRWFVTIDGKRHDLGPDKKAALTTFHELMARPQKRAVRSDSVVALIDAFLDWCSKHRSPVTYEWYRERLQSFAETYPKLTTAQLRPFHVQLWIDGEEGVSSGTRRNYCRSIKRAMRWAEQQGYVDRSPIMHMEQPRAGKRDTVISQEQFEELISLIPVRELRDLLITTWESGCRPQESLRVEARHVDLANSRWVFPQAESKGNIPRIVYLTDRALEITRRLVLLYPEGKLFRNSRGNPWTTESVNCAFVRLQIKMGLRLLKTQDVQFSNKEVREFTKSLARERIERGEVVQKSDRELELEARRKLRYRFACTLAPKCSLYTLRHSWATHALERGLDALTVAILMGH
ncbi:MAG: tyrosine-type recombinase/integrase [Pirellulales bacterium]|nr:tyrosine-type recombinase/integrase [Pirellulales bacterium]